MKLSKYFNRCFVIMAAAMTVVSCSDILDTKSDMVEFAENNRLNTAQDTLNSVMGIVRSMQTIGDRTIIFGEMRGDLVVPTANATTDLQQIANFQVASGNAYNKISDYYAIINNCNYFLANADTALSHLGIKTFEKEYAVVKTYRAWTYLQLAKVYGRVPLVLEPVLSENIAAAEQGKQYSDIQTICNYFIDDLKPYVDTDLPQYGTVGEFLSSQFFIPVRVLLGEMCLWTGRYQESAQYFYDYLAKKNDVKTTGQTKSTWQVSNLDFSTGNIHSATDLGIANNKEYAAIIPMESSEMYGNKSKLDDIFQSTRNNYYYYQATPSKAMLNLSASQTYCYLSATSESQKDTVYAPKTNLAKEYYAGDLRLCTYYKYSTLNLSETSEYSSEYQTLTKIGTNMIPLYRTQQIYLMFAEALNRAGYPESAFCILKYGLRNMLIEKYVSEEERSRAGNLLNFNDDDFYTYNTQGIHARGCGDVECDTTYCIPSNLSGDALIEYIEDLIITEDALEGAFEGWRYYDLMRIALRRNNPSYLARPISQRNAAEDATLYNHLMDTANWYLPIE